LLDILYITLQSTLLSAQALQYFLGKILPHDHYSIPVTYDDVSWHYDDVPATDGKVNFTRAAMQGADWCYASSVYGEANLLHIREIAD
jgi:hypothetical protein